MKKYLLSICFLFTMLFSVASSFAAPEVKIIDPKTKKETVIEVKSVETEVNTKKLIKTKAQIKAEQKASKEKLKAAAKVAKADEKLKDETAKIQAKEAIKQAKKDAKLKKEQTKQIQAAQKKQAKLDAKANKEAIKLQEQEKKAAAKEQSKAAKTNTKSEVTVVNTQKETKTQTNIVPTPVPVNNTTIKEEKAIETVETSKTETKNPEAEITTTTPVRLINTKAQSEIKYFFEDFAYLQNKHNLTELKKLYSDTFVNTDGYNKTQLFKLMKRTYESYPDLTTDFKIEQIVASNDFAMVYVKENVKATTKTESKITKDKGLYVSELHNIFYLKKISNVWTIYSEDVVYEVSKLAYGMGKGVTASISAPQKVLCGTEYSAAANVNIPKGYDAIGSVNRTQIVDGHNMAGETFRQFKIQDSVLERVMMANDKGNNEAVMVSIGFTKTSQDMFKKAKIDISGLVILMQRIDIIPANSNFKAAKENASEE